ncbi:MAG: aminotransferase class I/II-fold pyridoxal phosphate-dependent enzyme [Myxococcota bacterium]
MSALAVAHDAINLSQGFPDFEGPSHGVDAAVSALRAGHNQYVRSMGHPALAKAIAGHQRRWYGIDVDPMREVVVTTGATEAIAAAVLGLLEPGDEVILFEPFYDSYPALVSMAGGVSRYVTLRFPDFALDEDALRAQISAKTRMLVLNNPHNPSGKVFRREELALIARIAEEHDLLVLSDEVYEHLVYDGAVHIPFSTLAGMASRTVTASSTGKTFSFTGWKVGWLTGPVPLVEAAQAAHQFLTFCGAAPLQVAMAEALERCDESFLHSLRGEYQARRDLLVEGLRALGFDVASPRGTYFVLADHRALSEGQDDREFATRLVQQLGVAAIPPSAFYGREPAEGRRLLRFAFCKRLETLQHALGRLRGLRTR